MTEKCPSCGLLRIGRYDYCPKCGHHYDPAPKFRLEATYLKHKDCKWFEPGTGMFSNGMCRNPKKKFNKQYEGYGYTPTAHACKKCFEAKDEDNKTDR